MTPTTGMPIWYELLTADTDAAKRFYGGIVGWTTTAFPGEAGMDYHVWQVGETGVGGLAAPPPGVTPGWLAYFHVDDVDAKLAEVEAAGGTVAMPGMDIPDVGRIALVTDPQGVRFYLMRPAPPPGTEDQASTSFSPTLPGRCAWQELVTTDHKAALGFYGALLGWRSDEAMPMGEHGDYSFIDAGEVRLGAALDRMRPDQPLRWNFYFRVPDADAAAEQVKALGGQVVMGPMDVPGGERIVVALDPEGAGVGFVSGERQ